MEGEAVCGAWGLRVDGDRARRAIERVTRPESDVDAKATASPDRQGGPGGLPMLPDGRGSPGGSLCDP